MHIADFSIGMLGANGIVGAGFPIAVGAALAAQLEAGDRVGISFFGDGACHEGTFHESLNLASIWKLPIVFVCENNLYGAGTPASYAIPVKDIAERAAAYAIPAMIVDGNDVVAVYEAAQKAVATARAGEGPTFLECKTYRWGGHTESAAAPDPRPPEEVEAWKKKGPVVSLERRLLEAEILTRQEMEAIDGEVMSQIEDAVNYALESPLPDPQDALEDVYSVRLD